MGYCFPPLFLLNSSLFKSNHYFNFNSNPYFKYIIIITICKNGLILIFGITIIQNKGLASYIHTITVYIIKTFCFIIGIPLNIKYWFYLNSDELSKHSVTSINTLSFFSVEYD